MNIFKDYNIEEEKTKDEVSGLYFTENEIDEWLEKKSFFPKRINNKGTTILRGSTLNRKLIKWTWIHKKIKINICSKYYNKNKKIKWLFASSEEANILNVKPFIICKCGERRNLFIIHHDGYDDCYRDRYRICPNCHDLITYKYICCDCDSIMPQLKNKL